MPERTGERVTQEERAEWRAQCEDAVAGDYACYGDATQENRILRLLDALDAAEVRADRAEFQQDIEKDQHEECHAILRGREQRRASHLPSGTEWR